MFKIVSFKQSALLLIAVFLMSACGGSGSESAGTAQTNPAPVSATGAVVLRTPDLSFTDTGLSVTDGIIRNGRWGVESGGIDREFSLDLGATWTRGTGSYFEVKGDGAKMIWVRARDDAGNTSEIVRVNCVLDTMAPAAVVISGQSEGATNTLRLSGIEPGARWEYSLDKQRSWTAGTGTGTGLGILGNFLTRVWLRQVDMAGNPSVAQGFELQNPSILAHEASGDPLQPSILASGLQTYLIHGVVVRGDADYVRWETPRG